MRVQAGEPTLFDCRDGECKATTAREYLFHLLSREAREFFGVTDGSRIDSLVDAWMDDAGNSVHRFESVRRFFPHAKRVLDMASGCGTAFYYGMVNGFDMYGIDPDKGKRTFNGMKAKEYGYPPEWEERLMLAVGESLPFPDNSFDCVTSYQTLEHVQDVDQVIAEMIRVTRPQGGLHIRCPCYWSTYEGHYLLPWIPMMPRLVAQWYLRALGRPVKGLETLNYTSRGRLRRSIRSCLRKNPSWRLRVVDPDRDRCVAALKRRHMPALPGLFALHRARRHWPKLFKSELNVELVVYVERK